MTALLLVLTLFATVATAQTVDMTKYITLTVQQGQQIRFSFLAAADGTPVKIVSGSTESEVTVGTSWTIYQAYRSGATTMTIYGDIIGFDCYNNVAKLTAIDVTKNTSLTDLQCDYNQLTSLDVTQNTALKRLQCASNQLTSLDISQNTALTQLSCDGNQLTSLDVSQNTALTQLSCSDNQLASLDVSQNTTLQELYCDYNQLTSLDVSQNTALTWLSCDGNQLTSLDVSQNTALAWLYCSGNQLTSLDVSQSTSLKSLNCNGNNFTTQAFNDLMCALPSRTTAGDAEFYPLLDASDANHATFMDANSRIAKGKNWGVRYYSNGAKIPATSGTYVCPAVGIGEVATATATATKTTLNIAHLSAGTYIVRAGDRVAKVVKR